MKQNFRKLHSFDVEFTGLQVGSICKSTCLLVPISSYQVPRKAFSWFHKYYHAPATSMNKSNDSEPPTYDITLINAFTQRALASSQTLPREGRRLAENGRPTGMNDRQGGSLRDRQALIHAVITLALEEAPGEGTGSASSCGSTQPPPRRPHRDDDGPTN